MKIFESTTTRQLEDHELDIVNGGIIDGCIKLPGVPAGNIPPDWQYKDPFASILPSWVRNPPR